MGLDVERLGRVTPDLWPTLFTPRERKYLAREDDRSRYFLATAFFSIKEAFLKLPSPRPELVENYHAVEVLYREHHFSLRGNTADLRRHFGQSSLEAEIFRHGEFIVASILLD